MYDQVAGRSSALCPHPAMTSGMAIATQPIVRLARRMPADTTCAAASRNGSFAHAPSRRSNSVVDGRDPIAEKGVGRSSAAPQVSRLRGRADAFDGELHVPSAAGRSIHAAATVGAVVAVETRAAAA